MHSLENRCQCKDGTYRWISWNSFPLAEERLVFAVAPRYHRAQAFGTEAQRGPSAIARSHRTDSCGHPHSERSDVRIQLANSAAVAIRGDTDKPLTDINYELHKRIGKYCVLTG